MQRLGILGLGSRSTLWYLEQLNITFQQAKGGFSTLPFVLLNSDFDTINPYLPNDFKRLIPVLSESISDIQSLGIRALLIPNITLHETLDQLDALAGLSVIHPMQEGLQRLEPDQPVMLLGTRYTMSGEYFRKTWAGVDVHSPSEEDMSFIDELRKTAYEENPNQQEIARFAHMVIRWSADYQVVLACTELSLIYQHFEAERVIDLARLQITAAVQMVMADSL